MNENKYLKLRLDTFIYNAGIVGLVRQLEFCQAMNHQNGDYYFDGNVMFLNTDFLQNTDLSKLYVNVAVDKYEKETVYNEIIKNIDSLENLTEQLSSLELAGKQDDVNEIKKKLSDKYKYIADKLNRNSYKAAIDNLKDKKIETSIPDLLNKLKNTKEFNEKLKTAILIKQELKRPEIKSLLCFKDIMYSKINMLWNNRAFLLPASAKKDVFETYNKDFIEPLILSFKSSKNSRAPKYCISCGCETKQTTDLSFMNDSVEDLSRKKSVFWNQKPDAVLCPLCAYIYSLSPLGFNSYGNDLIFINNNDSVETLVRINENYKASSQIEASVTGSGNVRLSEYFNRIVEKEGEIAFNRISNIEVIIRSGDLNRFKFGVVGKDVIQVLRDCRKLFENLIKINEKLQNDEYVNVYQEVLFNLLNRQNQYMLIDKLLRARMSKENKTQPHYLMNILKVQINSRGRGKEIMSSRIGMLQRVAKEGHEIRKSFDYNENALRGLCYQLLNSLKVNNMEKFMDTVLRLYLGRSKPVPKEFLDAMKYEDVFLDTGYAFVLGLNGAAEEKLKDSVSTKANDNNTKEQNNNLKGWDKQ